ncbi:hypothetical protein JL720_8631 [Aureococcus anophagefferens]|nr:hypothetical protein JL720_8631 [Aureococcus anophagefferens]
MLLRLVAAATLVACAVGQGADMLDLSDTSVALAEKTREVTSFYSGSNTVYIGTAADGWVECDVIEGACTVDCGGDKKVVCDTQPWLADDYSGWLDIWVVVEDSISTYDLEMANAFYYLPSTHAGVPAGDADGAAALGRGRRFDAPRRELRRGGNVQNGGTAVLSTHALCRADDLNMAVNDETGAVDSFSLPVMVEDAVIGHNSPVTEDTVNCYLGDFAAGSYNASVFFDTNTRDESVSPALGSLEGGTLVTIAGGGFSDDASLVHVDVAGAPCDVVSSTLVEVVCRTGDLSKVDAGRPKDYRLELLSLEDAIGAPVSVSGATSWTVDDEDAQDSAGAWGTVSLSSAGRGAYVEAAGCATPPCTPSWLVLAPAAVDVDGAYDVSLVVPAAAGAGAGCASGAPLASSVSVLVADAVRGYVHLNVDPLAANYDSTASRNATRDCLYVGGRGLRQRAWSLMAPGYRDGTWSKDLDTLNAHDAGTTCRAPRNASAPDKKWKNESRFHRPCGDDAYCCLTNDYWGCDATWDLADADGWVDVLRQDTEMGAPFADQQWRRAAHDREAANYAILDELEYMRTLGSGGIELKLEWPDTGLDYMHWAQRMNPTQFNARIKAEQYDEELGYEQVYVPYFEDDAWGGLEYNGGEALLDGGFNDAAAYFAVGSTSSAIKTTTGDDWVEATTATRVLLRAKPDYLYFVPKCVECEACYDADGYLRGDQTIETYVNASCKSGRPCAVNNTRTRTVAGCPSRCKHKRIRAFEAAAAHEALVVANRYDDDFNCTASENVSCAGFDATNFGDIGPAPTYGPGAGAFEGFFVAPVAANYTFLATWDSALEVSLSASGDPRRREVILGGPLADAPSDGDVVGDWTYFDGHWYKLFAGAGETWADARDACAAEGAYLAETNGQAEHNFVTALIAAQTLNSFQVWLGGSARDFAGMWEWRTTGELFSAGAHHSDLANAPAVFTRWNANEPNGNGVCVAQWASGGTWDDKACSAENEFLCESVHAAAPAAVELARGEARHFELLHVHNSSVGGAILGLELLIETADDSFSTKVSGSHSLSMEFFREISSEPLPVVVSVGETAATALASACYGKSCAFAYSPDATPTVTRVTPAGGTSGQLVTVEGSLFSTIAGEVTVGIGGAACEVSYVNESAIECVLAEDEAQGGTYPVDVYVAGLGAARQQNASALYTVEVRVDDFAPKNGSLHAGDIVRIWGRGFSRFGPQNEVDVAGARCVPRTLKNFACRVSEYDSGYACAWTSEDWKGYAMVANAHAKSADRANSEWLDYSSTTYVECVLEDDVAGLNDTRTGPVTVTLAREAELHDAGVVRQTYAAAVADQLDMATRDLDCFVLLGYRIWNWGLELKGEDDRGNATYTPVKDCVLWDDDYDQRGTFLDDANYTGASAQSSGNYTFLAAETPVVASMDALGMAGQEITLRGANFDANVAEWDFHWRMDEFGFYTQPESPVVYVGGSPTVLTFANATMIKLLPTYNMHDIAWDVDVWIRGRGLAGGNKSFVYANYLYEVAPRRGSTEGGTTLTLSGSGFTNTHTFYAAESGNDMGDDRRRESDSRADYTITLPGGTLCDVTASSKYELQCVTRALADDAYAEAPGLVDAEVAWNYEPFYFGCALRTCAPPGCKRAAVWEFNSSMLAVGDPDEKLCLFEFTKESTPKFDHAPVRSNATFNRDSWFVAPGGSLTLDVVKEAPGGFNWTNISETLGGEDELADLFRVTVGGANCTGVAFDDDLKALTCAVDADAAVELAGALSVFASGRYGYAELTGKTTLDVRPTVANLSQSAGSLNGGTRLVVEGAGFEAGATSVVVDGVASCGDVVVLNSSTLSCVTDRVATASKDATFGGELVVTVSGIPSACVAKSCDYAFQGNDTRYTPRVAAVSGATAGTYASGATLVLVGEGFATRGNAVLIGETTCPVVAENETLVECAVPKHAAGVFEVRLRVPGKGYAVGHKLWYRSDFKLSTQVLSGSLYGGQSITLAGKGFPVCSVDAQETSGLCRVDRGCTWETVDGADVDVAFSATSGASFGVDVVSSSYDGLSLVTTLRDVDGTDADADSGDLTVSVVFGNTGAASTASANVVAADGGFTGDGSQGNAFDSSAATYWEAAWPAGWAFAPLTYDLGETTPIGSYSVSRDATSCDAWTLKGSEDGIAWDTLDVYNNTGYNGTRTVSALVNGSTVSRTVHGDCIIWGTEDRTIDAPGLYRYYRWSFFQGAIMDDLDGYLRVKDISMTYASFASNATYSRTSASTPSVDRVLNDGPGYFREIVRIAARALVTVTTWQSPYSRESADGRPDVGPRAVAYFGPDESAELGADVVALERAHVQHLAANPAAFDRWPVCRADHDAGAFRGPDLCDVDAQRCAHVQKRCALAGSDLSKRFADALSVNWSA